MTLLYGRKLKLLGAPSAGGEALDLSELHCRFAVRQFELSTPNTADVRVFNVTPQTAARFDKEFNRVILQAGYEGQFGTIFDGTIVQARRGRTSPADTYLDLTAFDGDRAHNFAVVNTTLAAGATPADVHRALTASMRPHGATVGYTAELPGPALPRGRALYGMAREHLRALCDATGTTWNIVNGEVVMLPRTGYVPGEAIVLSGATGLVGFPQQTQDGIMLRCLLNPLLRVGNRIRLDNDKIQEARLQPDAGGNVELQRSRLPKKDPGGTYRVLAVDHAGDTRGQEWYSEIACIGLDAPIPVSQAQRGRSDTLAAPEPLPAAATAPAAPPGGTAQPPPGGGG